MSIKSTILNSVLFTYILIIISTVFLGGFITRFYGNTCGISPFEPSYWVYSFILMGSPYCKMLNFLCYACNSILENIWIHFGAILMTQFMKYIPSCFKTRDIPMRDNSSFRNLNLPNSNVNPVANNNIVLTEMIGKIPNEGYNLRNRNMPPGEATDAFSY